jgi:signal transduction histidine kinase/putative methionine-R-sulfoxide reductase with GAF domain
MGSSAAELPIEENSTKFQILLDFARYMGQAKDLDTLLKYIAGEVPKALRSDRCTIFLLDDEKQQAWSRVLVGEEKEIRFPLGKGIAGAVIESGNAIIVENAYADDRFNKNVDIATGFKTTNILCVPLRNLHNKTIGCFQVLNKDDGLDFNDADQEFLEGFASQAAISIESVQLFMQRESVIADLEFTKSLLQDKVQQIEVLYDVERASALMSNDHEFMQYAIEQAVSGIGGLAGSILLKDENDRYVRNSFKAGESSSEARKTHECDGEGISGAVFVTGNSVIENNIPKRKNYTSSVTNHLDFKAITLIAAPLYLQDPTGSSPKIVGVAEVINSLSRMFTRDDLKFLESICGKITSMIARRKMIESKTHNDRLATIGTLTDTIIHDFKNPLAVIKGMAQIMGAHEVSREKTEKFCTTIARQIDRCVNMTREILDFSQGNRIYSKSLIGGKEFIDDVTELLEFECEQKKTKFIITNDLKSDIRIDIDRVKRVIYNLTNNAFEIMKDNDPVLTVSATENDGTVEIRVTDNGPGVPEGFQPKLFEAFATQGKAHGTGLGLHIAAEVISNHGGTLTYDSSFKDGASFVIKFDTFQEK